MRSASRAPSVLIAEDDGATRALMTALVRDMGYPTVSAPDGAAALKAFQGAPAQIVISDWLMPGMDGLELCRQIRESERSECFFMLVTSRDDSEDLLVALAAGVDDYLAKPLVSEHLRARLLIAERQLALAKARRDAEHEAARMRWLAGIGQTVLTFQHEINNPLTALYGHLEVFMSDATLSPAQIAEASGAFEQARRIAGIVTQLASARNHSIVEPVAGHPMLAVGQSPFATVPHADSMRISQ